MADMEIKIPIEVKGDADGKKLGASIGEAFKEKAKGALQSIGLGGGSGKSQGRGKGFGSKLLGFGKLIGGIGLLIGGVMFVGGILKKMANTIAQNNPVMKSIFSLLSLFIFLLFLPLNLILMPVLRALMKALQKTAGGIAGVLSGEVGPGEWIGNVIKEVGPILVEGIKQFAKFFATVWDEISGPISEALMMAFETLTPLFTDIFELLATVFISNIPEILSAFFGAMMMGFESIADKSVKRFGKGWSGIIGLVLFALGAIGLFIAGGWVVAIIGVLVAIVAVFGKDIWNGIKWLVQKWLESWVKTIELWKNIGKWMWDKFTAIISSSLNVLKGIGQWIKSAVMSLFGGGSRGSKKVNDFILRPNGELIETSPDDTIIGVKDTSNLGGSDITININNPIVREENDIREIVNQVSMILQKQITRRISSR